MRTRTLAAVVVLLASLLSAACTPKSTDRDALEKVIARSEQLARQYTYSEAALGHHTVVTGVVADDLRYSAHVTVDGQDAMDEVVRDDDRAMRITSPALLALGMHSGQAKRSPSAPAPQTSPAPSPSDSPSPSAAEVAAAGGIVQVQLPSGVPDLQAGKWVLDPAGATSLTQVTGLKTQLGTDPVLDSLTVLQYVTQVIDQSAGVVLFNPESPDYRSYEDPFPRPDKSVGELRYDVLPVPLAPRDQVGGSQFQLIQALPRANYFRHLSVYVRNGLVVTVRESISALWRLKDTQQDILPRLADLGVHLSANLPPAALAQEVIDTLNRFETRADQEPIRPRDMVLTLSKLGSAGSVELPAGTTTASLNGIFERGQVLNQSASLAVEGT